MQGGRGEVGDEVVVEFSRSRDFTGTWRGVICTVVALGEGDEACIEVDLLAICSGKIFKSDDGGDVQERSATARTRTVARFAEERIMNVEALKQSEKE